MTIVEGDDVSALAERYGTQKRVSTLLLGNLAPGTKVLVHLDAAMRVLDEVEAQLIDNALTGLAAAIDGQDFDHLFADLIDREPQLPEHLRPQSLQPVTE